VTEGLTYNARKETRMKRQRIGAGFLGILVLSMVLACAGGPKPSQRTEILDDKGAALGTPTPQWVTAFDAGGYLAVEALGEYQSYNCFVIDATSADKPFLLAWVNNLNGPAAIAEVISTVVNRNVTAMSANIEEGERQRIIRTNTEMMSNASFNGARKVADWWYLSRNRTTKVEEYRAFALYIFDREALSDQLARKLQNIMDNNAAISDAEQEIYLEMIDQVRVNGFQQ
jgi:hypothetical protein